MGFRFRKRLRILPGLFLNASKSGVSVSAGAHGATSTSPAAKRRERAYYSHRAFTTCAVSSLGKVKSSTSALTRSF